MNQHDFSNHIKIVLLRTTHPGNVGSVARAMKNMGLHNLALVSPEFNKIYTEADAISRAAGAEDILNGACHYDSLDEAIADCTILIGASARSRKMPWPLMNPRDCVQMVLNQLVPSKPITNKIAFLFGQEASGLSNEELQRCHYHVNIPAVDSFSSLNLAMAVQVICYELRMGFLSTNSQDNLKYNRAILTPMDEGWDEPLAENAEVEGFMHHLEETLIDIKFHDPDKPRQLMTRLRRLFQRAHMDKMEVNILRGILSSIQKGLK